MLRTSVAALALIVAGTFSAQAKMDCDAHYKNFWEKVVKVHVALQPRDIAIINRAGARAYDACQAGDEQAAEDQFKSIKSEIDLSPEAVKILKEEGFGK